jgi:hypothetical protein
MTTTSGVEVGGGKVGVGVAGIAVDVVVGAAVGDEVGWPVQVGVGSSVSAGFEIDEVASGTGVLEQEVSAVRRATIRNSVGLFMRVSSHLFAVLSAMDAPNRS